jgi:hypothetical protein
MGNTEKTAELLKALSQNECFGVCRLEECVASDQINLKRDNIKRVV